MRRPGFLLLALTLFAAPVLAQEAGDAPVDEQNEEVEAEADAPTFGPVPVWLPRAVFVGAFFQEGALVPQGRLQWSATLIKQRNDALVGFLEAGGGFGLTLPRISGDVMTSFYQHLAMVGLGYDAVYSTGWSWGFQVLTGAHWYGAKYRDEPDEDAIGGTVEGRGQIGLSIGSFRLMFSAGWAQLWVVPRDSVAAQFTGGPIFGIYLNWRPVEKTK